MYLADLEPVKLITFPKFDRLTMNYEISNPGSFKDTHPELVEMMTEVKKGLSSKPKTLPCKYLYDKKGSDLFQKICRLPEYYLTRTETSLLVSIAGEIAELVGPGCQMIEYGSGSSEKMRIILSALTAPESFTAVDISKEHLFAATNSLSRDFPLLKVNAVTADFAKPFTIPTMIGNGLRMGFFPGSTIGNFSHEEVVDFLKGTREAVGPQGVMLIGVDLKKDEQILRAAYNDSQGVTAAFNINLLARLNRDLGATFKLNQFQHNAYYDAALGRIEMHLVSLMEQSATLGSEVISFRKGETIHTENSYKYSQDQFKALSFSAGYKTIKAWTDPNLYFGMFFLQAEA